MVESGEKWGKVVKVVKSGEKWGKVGKSGEKWEKFGKSGKKKFVRSKHVITEVHGAYTKNTEVARR